MFHKCIKYIKVEDHLIWERVVFLHEITPGECYTHPNESWTHDLTLQPIIIGEGRASWGIAHWQNYIFVLLVKLASYE